MIIIGDSSLPLRSDRWRGGMVTSFQLARWAGMQPANSNMSDLAGLPSVAMSTMLTNLSLLASLQRGTLAQVTLRLTEPERRSHLRSSTWYSTHHGWKPP